MKFGSKEMIKKAAEAKKLKQAIAVETVSKIPDKHRSYFKDIPKPYLTLMIASYQGKLPYSKAVKAKCLDCSCYDKTEITNCTVKTCPLFSLRPYQKN